MYVLTYYSLTQNKDAKFYHPMTRREIKKILKRNYGSVAELARRAGIKANAVSMWLAGGPNSNIDPLAQILAKELLTKEEADRIAKGHANGVSVRAALPDLRKPLEKPAPEGAEE